MTTNLRRVSYLMIGLLGMVVMSSAAYAQDGKSVGLVKELTQLLDAKKLTAIAAKDGTDPESYVAAMYFSGSQMLVVGAKYAPAVLLDGKLLRRDYQDVYIDLNSASKPGTKTFIEDMGADGLRADHAADKAADSIDRAGTPTKFDDGWRKDQKMTDADYAKALAAADALYCRYLAALIVEAKK